ncbi:MAG: 4a-hydroxytetrahydrobiopterin dehydratase [Verrucomicrobiota bacterium]
MADLIEEGELESMLKKVPEWELEDKRLFRVFEFDEFMDGSIDFVNGVADICEEINHHADIQVNWCTVTLSLTTHDQGGITENDFDLAQKIDTLVD